MDIPRRDEQEQNQEIYDDSSRIDVCRAPSNSSRRKYFEHRVSNEPAEYSETKRDYSSVPKSELRHFGVLARAANAIFMTLL